MSYKLLAFDQSTAKTGWAFFIGDQLINYGLIDKSKIKDTPERIRLMFFDIISQIETLNPDIVAVENVQQQVNPATSMMLSQLEGMIIGYLYEHNIRVESLNPVSWRKTVGFKQGKGVLRTELKKQSLKYVNDMFDINISSDDVADAICIGTAIKKVFEV